ncbi:hypothetical protein LOD99_13035 [Oopsacas minuta]|uniref:Uncharacterized protein n=1 Tax=Oopsacas minuta TaxID=111878 RepID=A0AAV7JAP2_9METZ|nr:hypothetical protein LOD99_13035 [Oopsacas minuta]
MENIEENRSEDTENSDEEIEYREADFPKNRGYFNKVELVRLALCIGFNTDLFTVHFSHIDSDIIDEEGVTREQVLDLLYTYDFNISIHKTMNIHSQEYNERLIRKVVHLLEEGKIGFSELKQISRVYSFYECKDGDGMSVDSLTILSALKMCNRVMGLLQLKNEIARRADIFEIPKRLTMYELIDFYLVSQSLSYWEQLIEVPELPEGKDEGEETYTLTSPHQLEGLQYERILTSLDDEYRKLLYQPVQTKQEKIDVTNLVNPRKRLQLYEKSRSDLAKDYKNYIKSEKRIWRARAGYCPDPLRTQTAEKKRKKGTVGVIDYSKLDMSRHIDARYRHDVMKYGLHTEEITERDEEVVDLKWKMIRSETKLENKLKEIRQGKSKRSDESNANDLIPSIMSSLNLTLKSIQGEINSPRKKGNTPNLSAKRLNQITKRFENLDSRFVEEIVKDWITTSSSKL